jgi:hypothetical protein
MVGHHIGPGSVLLCTELKAPVALPRALQQDPTIVKVTNLLRLGS